MFVGLGMSLVSKLRLGGSAAPVGAIRQRDSAYILDRAGNYIEVRA